MVTSLNISSDGWVVVVFEMVVEEIVWVVFEDAVVLDVRFMYEIFIVWVLVLIYARV